MKSSPSEVHPLGCEAGKKRPPSYAGEEFLVVLPGIAQEEAIEV